MKKKLLAFGMAVLMLTGCGSSSGTIRFGAAGPVELTICSVMLLQKL